jgi:hypothetical protein
LHLKRYFVSQVLFPSFFRISVLAARALKVNSKFDNFYSSEPGPFFDSDHSSGNSAKSYRQKCLISGKENEFPHLDRMLGRSPSMPATELTPQHTAMFCEIKEQ